MSEIHNIMLNREVGLIQFNRRVLAKAFDTETPLLERLSYLCIVSLNCDELFEVRIARLLKLNKNYPNKILSDGLKASKALSLVRDNITKLYNEIYSAYNILIPELRKNNIFILKKHEWDKMQQDWIYNYFLNELKPMLTPAAIDSTDPFPRVPNKSLHFAVELKTNKSFEQNLKIAIVEAPRALPRVVKLPNEISNNQDVFILLQDIIKEHIRLFFHGMDVCGCYPFRVTRSADINLKVDPQNIRSAVTQEIKKRKYAECSRLELDITDGIPNKSLINVLLKQFNISIADLFLANGPVNLSRLREIYDIMPRPELKFPQFIPGLPNELINEPDIFKAMDKQDILIHTPYQSFDPVVELTKRAVNDPDVLEIKMTVYRTGLDSELAQNLIKAAKKGKKVVASVELFARFSEEINVELAKQLEEAGANVVYGIMGYKVHSKMLLVVRKYKNSLKYYAHLGTGNYHQTTTKIYSDFGILTTNKQITDDVNSIFAKITGTGKAGILNCLSQAPFTLHDMILQKIETETINAQNGNLAKIIAKMNSLIEPKIIKALYNASQKGVKIILIIRGACALRPNIKGLSENIMVKSIVGRFLEHERIFYFYNSGLEDVYLSSADWMKRNFFRRVETCVPILDEAIKKRIFDEALNIDIKDNVESWIMQSDGTYKLFVSHGEKICAQKYLMLKLGKILTL